MLHRIIVIGTRENTDLLFKQLEQLPNSACIRNPIANGLSLFAMRELTLKSGNHTYSFQRYNTLPSKTISADLCIACDEHPATQSTLQSLASNSIAFIPYTSDMSIDDLMSELKDRFESLLPETMFIPVEQVVIEKSLGQKAAAAASRTASSAASAATAAATSATTAIATSAASAAIAANELATSLVHQAALFPARIEAARATTPAIPDVHSTVGNNDL